MAQYSAGRPDMKRSSGGAGAEGMTHSIWCHPAQLTSRIVPRASALSHSNTQSVGMTDPQIFAFLVPPFLFVLTCSMVFFSTKRMKPDKPVGPPASVIRPAFYTRKPRKHLTSAK